MTTLERLLAKTSRQADGCWHWTGYRDRVGYGQVTVNYRRVQAHRAMYEQMVGPIPAGLELDHLCLVRNCVNPAHLEPVTRAENVRRAKVARAGRGYKQRVAS